MSIRQRIFEDIQRGIQECIDADINEKRRTQVSNIDLADLPPEVAALVKSGIPLHKALAMAGLKKSKK